MLPVSLVLQKYANEIIEAVLSMIADERFDEDSRKSVSARPILERESAVRVKAPAIHRISVDRTIRRDIYIKQAGRLQNPQSFKENEPEKFRMLEAGR